MNSGQKVLKETLHSNKKNNPVFEWLTLWLEIERKKLTKLPDRIEKSTILFHVLKHIYQKTVEPVENINVY